MVTNSQDDRLPPGWKLEIRVSNSRKIKCYVNSKTHKKFYSKISMLRYIEDQNAGSKQSSLKKEHVKESSGEMQLQDVETNDLHEWLPSGWIVESRTRKSGIRKGTKYKCFIEPATGNKFFSKPEVYRYLESTQNNAGSSQWRKRRSSRHSSNNKSPDPPSPLQTCLDANVSQLSKTRLRKSHSLGKKEVVVKTTVDNELPLGWIKETRNKLLGKRIVRSDPFYIEPTTGLVFRSKPDALRYIRTGEISRHAYRRKTRSFNSEELTLVKTTPLSSDEREKALNSTRKQLFSDEVNPKQGISLVPETRCIRETRSKSGRSISGVGPAAVQGASLEQSTFMQPMNIVRDLISEKSLNNKATATEVIEGKTMLGMPKVRDVDGKKVDAAHGESKPVAMEVCSNEKSETSKRKMKDRKTPNLPSRSSKRLAGIDVEVIFHAKPIEYVLPASNRSSRKSQVRLGTIHSESQEKAQNLNVARQIGLATKEELRPPSNHTQTMLATQEYSSSEVGTLTKRSSQERDKNLQEYLPGFSRSQTAEALPIKADQSLVGPTDTLAGSKNQRSPGMKGRKTPNLPSRSSKRLAGVDAEVVFHTKPIEHILRGSNRKPRKTQVNPSLGSITSESEKMPRSLNFTAQQEFASPGEKFQAPKTDTQTVLASQEDPLINIDISIQRIVRELEMELQEYPPGFPQKPRTEALATKANQPSVVLSDKKAAISGSETEKSPGDIRLNVTTPESKIEKSCVVEEQRGTPLSSRIEKSTGDFSIQVEKPAISERATEQPESQFCFPSPLWSDPCLEFAYKTLTGAIPLDDNLAIDDYVQHQLRTSKQSDHNRSLPDTGTPGFFQSNETKPVSPLPENISRPNSNGFGSNRPGR